jgi:hypothetical protein
MAASSWRFGGAGLMEWPAIQNAHRAAEVLSGEREGGLAQNPQLIWHPGLLQHARHRISPKQMRVELGGNCAPGYTITQPLCNP